MAVGPAGVRPARARSFDPNRVGGRECRAWAAYYGVATRTIAAPLWSALDIRDDTRSDLDLTGPSVRTSYSAWHDGGMAARPGDAILSLPVDERLALVDSIWESLRENADALPSDERTWAEMQRRLELYREDADLAEDLDVVLARLRAKD